MTVYTRMYADRWAVEPAFLYFLLFFFLIIVHILVLFSTWSIFPYNFFHRFIRKIKPQPVAFDELTAYMLKSCNDVIGSRFFPINLQIDVFSIISVKPSIFRVNQVLLNNVHFFSSVNPFKTFNFIRNSLVAKNWVIF